MMQLVNRFIFVSEQREPFLQTLMKARFRGALRVFTVSSNEGVGVFVRENIKRVLVFNGF